MPKLTVSEGDLYKYMYMGAYPKKQPDLLIDGLFYEYESFTDKTFVPWKEVKRRENPTRPDRAESTRKILTKTGNLGRSIEYNTEPGQVIIFSELDYAAAHNEGTTTAGRNNNVTIPKRQFIGESETFDKKVLKIMKEGTDRILK